MKSSNFDPEDNTDGEPTEIIWPGSPPDQLPPDPEPEEEEA